MFARRSLVVVVAALAAGSLSACVAPASTLHTAGVRPRLDPGDPTIEIEPDGTMRVTLPVCRQKQITVRNGEVVTEELPCPDRLDDLWVTAPWGRSAHARVDNTGGLPPRARVSPSWGEVPLDPLDRRTWAIGARPWKIAHPLLAAPVTWTPNEAQLEWLAHGMGAAAGIDVSVGAASYPPDLVVGELRASNDELLAGGATALELSIENRGEGPAYRVVATVRSSVAALHGVQFSFGKILPGQRLSRRVRVELPPTEPEPSAMLVLVLAEANGFAPANVSKRIPIRVVASVPRLVATCTLPTDSPEVDAGQVVRLRCLLANEGGRLARRVEVTATLGADRSTAAPVDVGPRARAMVEVPVRIPPGATIDQQLVIEVVAADAGATARATTRVQVIVRRPGQCPTGRLDRAQYLAKRRSLEEARAAGDLTADEFDRYDAELVGCLDQ
jgi:hypothetical protein